jgi:O-antigen ligase
LKARSGDCCKPELALNKLIFTLLMLLVVISALPFGSNREWAWLGCVFIVSMLAFCWGISAAFNSRIPMRWPDVNASLMFLLVCAWVLIQISPDSPSAWHQPLWTASAEALNIHFNSRITSSADDTTTALIRLATYGVVFLMAFNFCLDANRAAQAFKWIAVASLINAIYGLAVYAGGYSSVFWFVEDGFSLDVRGTFINRNSFATYLGLGLLCLVALQFHIAGSAQRVAYLTAKRPGWRTEQFILRNWGMLTTVLLMVSALILTHSRGGFISSVLGGCMLLYIVNKKQKHPGVRSKKVIGSAFAVAILAFVLTSEVLLQRMDRIETDAAGRFSVFEQTASGIERNPWLGWGYGTYSDSFRPYRNQTLTAHYDKAHNTYLENIFELGWPAAIALFACIGLLIKRCYHGMRIRQKDWIFPATGIAATMLVAIHSLFDFSLQIPAIAICYSCIMGVACAQSYSSQAS